MNALELFFDWLLAASFRASMLSGVVLIIRTMLRHRIPARWRYALWLPVLRACFCLASLDLRRVFGASNARACLWVLRWLAS